MLPAYILAWFMYFYYYEKDTATCNSYWNIEQL